MGTSVCCVGELELNQFNNIVRAVLCVYLTHSGLGAFTQVCNDEAVVDDIDGIPTCLAMSTTVLHCTHLLAGYGIPESLTTAAATASIPALPRCKSTELNGAGSARQLTMYLSWT